MLALFGRTRIISTFRRTRFLARPVVVLGALALVARMTSLNRRTTLPLFEGTFLRTVGLAIARCRTDFEFVQLVPFRVRAITFRNGVELANPAAQIDGLRIIHGPYYGPVSTYRSTFMGDCLESFVDALAARHSRSAL